MTFFRTIRKLNLKLYMIIFLSLLALWEMIQSGDFLILPHLPAAVGVAVLLDSGIHYLKKRKISRPLSAIITGLLVGSILSPDERLWVVALAAAVAIASKHLIRFRNRHLFNPAVFGLLVVSLFFSAPLVWWSSGNTWAVLIFGLIIAARFKRFHLLLAYILPFAVLMSIYAMKNGYPVWPHVMFLNFYFLVFMVVEPKTSPLYRRGRIIYGALTAVLTFVFFYILPQYDASVLSLAAANLAIPVLNYWEKRRKSGRR